MYTTIDYKDVGALYGIMIFAILFFVYVILQPWIDLYMYGTEVVGANLTKIRFLLYGIPLVPVLISLLPFVYIYERFNRKYILYAVIFTHIAHQVISGNNIILNMGYILIKSSFMWLFGTPDSV